VGEVEWGISERVERCGERRGWERKGRKGRKGIKVEVEEDRQSHNQHIGGTAHGRAAGAHR
jgi:hypothetical protein